MFWWNLHNYAGEQAGGTEEPTEPKLMADGNEMQIFSLFLRVLLPEEFCRLHQQNAVIYNEGN